MSVNLTLPNTDNNTDFQISQKHYAFESIEHCDIFLGLNKNLEFYFGSSELAENSQNLKNTNKNSAKSNDYFNDIDTEYNIKNDKYLNQFLNVKNPSEESINLKNDYLKGKEKNLLNV